MTQVVEPNAAETDASDSDLLYGADEIRAFLSTLFARPINKRSIYHWIDAGRFPAGKFGGVLMGSKRKIRDAIERVVAGE